VTHLIPDGFLSIHQAAETLATAMYSGVPDRQLVAKRRQEGYDSYDGVAMDDAVSELWKGYDEGKVQGLLIGPRQPVPIKLPSDLAQGIPALRSSRGRDFTFARGRYRLRLTELFGPDLSTVQVVFREMEVKRLARTLLRVRRRKAAPIGQKKLGRPSLQSKVQSIVRNIIELGQWRPTSSIKALTAAVNRKALWPRPVSEDTVARALQHLQQTTKDRRYERVAKKGS
jgi:hypothetical protein